MDLKDIIERLDLLEKKLDEQDKKIDEILYFVSEFCENKDRFNNLWDEEDPWDGEIDLY